MPTYVKNQVIAQIKRRDVRIIQTAAGLPRGPNDFKARLYSLPDHGGCSGRAVLTKLIVVAMSCWTPRETGHYVRRAAFRTARRVGARSTPFNGTAIFINGIQSELLMSVLVYASNPLRRLAGCPDCRLCRAGLRPGPSMNTQPRSRRPPGRKHRQL